MFSGHGVVYGEGKAKMYQRMAGSGYGIGGSKVMLFAKRLCSLPKRAMNASARKLLGGATAMWHGSLNWGWFAVLLLGALTMTSSGEYGAGLALGLLSVLSGGSKYWHWASTATGIFWKRTRSFVFLPMSLLALLSFFEVNDMRADAAWSHLPRAWNAMLIATTVRLTTISPPSPTPPAGPPASLFLAPQDVPHLPTISFIRPVTVMAVASLQPRQVGEKPRGEVRVRNNMASALTVRVWESAINEPIFDDKEKNWALQEQLWEKLRDYIHTTKAATQSLPSNNEFVAIPLEGVAATPTDLDNFKSRAITTYLMLVVKDFHNKIILEVCVYTQPDGGVSYCRFHNGP